MPELQVKKVVAVCFLESAKLSLEHLGAHRLSRSQSGVAGPGALPRMYGDVRRLRDYLQRSVSGYQDVVALDLSEGDAALLVACCRRSVEAIEHRLVDGAVPPDERRWLARKLEVLSDWAVEMAAKPLMELPLSHLGTSTGEAVRTLTFRLTDKVFGDVAKRQKFCAPQSGPSSKAQGTTTFGESLAGDQAVGDPYQEAAEEVPAQLSLSPSLPSAPPPARDVLPPLLDRRKLHDPRLRSLIRVDMNALNRCQRDGDHRLATVLLASVMESVVIDHAVPRRSEFGLSGTPDTWNVQDVLLRAMGDCAQPKDRALSFHLFASRNLLRPALQMVTPAVVTAASFELLHDFVSRALHALGFGAPIRTLPPGAMSTEDLPR